MLANGAIDAQTAKAATAKPATPKLSPRLAQAQSWFADWVGTQAAAVPGSLSSSVGVRTTLMPDLQRLAEKIVNDTLARQGRRLHASQGALVAMRPDGAVLAMVGGRDYRNSQFNRAVDARRQPGSAFKLFVYLAALRHGYSPQDTIDASSIDIKGWEPENYGGAHYGRLTLAEAFARSVNTAAVRLAMNVGLKQVIAAARDLGVDTPLPPFPSMALGAVSINLLDLTSAFASVRANRKRVKPWGIAVAREHDGSLRAMRPPVPTEALDPYQRPLIELLRGVVEHGTGRAAALDGFAAGKTGTSQDYRDAWFIGFNDELVVGVWIGNDDNSPMRRVAGGSLPASIWKEFMTKAAPRLAQENMAIAAAPAPTEDQPGDGQASHPDDSAGDCDQRACARHYSSFRSSDCTYQPHSGESRRLCEINKPSTSAAQRALPETTGAGTSAECNVDACSRKYSSFNPSDCTYQPFGARGRQLCER